MKRVWRPRCFFVVTGNLLRNETILSDFFSKITKAYNRCILRPLVHQLWIKRFDLNVSRKSIKYSPKQSWNHLNWLNSSGYIKILLWWIICSFPFLITKESEKCYEAKYCGATQAINWDLQIISLSLKWKANDSMKIYNASGIFNWNYYLQRS